MNQKNLVVLSLLIVFALLSVGLILVYGSGLTPQPSTVTQEQTVSTIYSDGTSQVEAWFNNQNNTVTFTLAGLGTVTLPQAESASGARYASQDGSLVFWEHQGQVTITQNGNDIFQGTVVATAPSGSQDLTDGVWVWERTVMGDDTVVVPNQAGAFTLTFHADGSVNGTTDCNSFRGGYTLEGVNSVSFGPMATTMMFCDGSQEQIFTSALSQVSNYVFDATGNLVLNMQFDSGSLYFSQQ